jgi:hypothetical protein
MVHCKRLLEGRCSSCQRWSWSLVCSIYIYKGDMRTAVYRNTHTHTYIHTSRDIHPQLSRIRHRGLGGKGVKYQGGAQLDCLLHQQPKVNHTCILLYHALSGLTLRACMNPGRSKHIITGCWGPHQSAASAVCMCHSKALSSGHTEAQCQISLQR